MSEKRFVAHNTSVGDYVESLDSKNTKEKTKRGVKLLEEFLRNEWTTSEKCTLFSQQNQTSILQSLFALLDVKTGEIMSPEAWKSCLKYWEAFEETLLTRGEYSQR